MHSYVVVIEKTDSNFSAYLPDLPGCVATGTSREETEANMREALKLPHPRALGR
jgi:predicted RNase H-like HicB family nuclease